MTKYKPYSKRGDLPSEEVVSRYRAGESLAQIARSYSTSSQTVSRLLEQNGVPRRPAHGTPETAPGTGTQGIAASLPTEQVISRYRQGASLADLATAYGVSVSTIVRVMDSRGEPRRSSKPKAGITRVVSPEAEAEVIRRNAAGQSMRAIAAELDISHGSIRNVLDRKDTAPSTAPGSRRDLPMDEITNRLAEGETVAALAAAYGVSRATLHRRLKDMR